MLVTMNRKDRDRERNLHVMIIFLLFFILSVEKAVFAQKEVEIEKYNPDAHYKIFSDQLQALANQMHRVALVGKDESSQIRGQEYKAGSFKLDLKNLTRVLEVNDHSVKVQSRCRFDHLVKSLRPFNRIPAVVPEFKSITVGGAIAGGALESTSHWAGQVSDCVISARVLLGNGTIVEVLPGTEIFNALPGSYGTLGIILDATLQTVPSKPYVQATTTSYSKTRDGLAALVDWSQSEGKPHFLEGMQFPDGKTVLIAGEFIDPVNEPATRLETPYGLWFYEMIGDRANLSRECQLTDRSSSCHDKTVMNIPTYDYLFRYERGAFWMARPLKFSIEALTPTTAGLFFASWRNIIPRLLFRWYFTATNLYRLLHKASYDAVEEKLIILDAYMPAHTAIDLVEYVRDHIPLTTPIWLCPVRAPNQPQPLSPSGHYVNQMLVNVGIYGRVTDNKAAAYTRALEHKISELGGRKMLYSQMLVSKEELYTKYVDGEAYVKLRETLMADAVFAPLHEKLIRKPSEKSGLRFWLSRLLL